MQQKEETNMYYSQPSSDINSIMYRINPQNTLKRIRENILGYREGIIKDEKTGATAWGIIKMGRPKVNEEGYHAIMFYVENVVNEMNVQGNFDTIELKDFIADFHDGLYNDCFENQAKYGLSDNDFKAVVRAITLNVRAFMSRTLGNKERESLSQSQKVSESVITNPKQPIFKRWGMS